MASDHFKNQIEWINGLTGDERAKAGSVVAWQCVMTTINELVRRFNDITFGMEEPQFKHDREVQLKKVIVPTFRTSRRHFLRISPDLGGTSRSFVILLRAHRTRTSSLHGRAPRIRGAFLILTSCHCSPCLGPRQCPTPPAGLSDDFSQNGPLT
jgi:hypothetical protein